MNEKLNLSEVKCFVLYKAINPTSNMYIQALRKIPSDFSYAGVPFLFIDGIPVFLLSANLLHQCLQCQSKTGFAICPHCGFEREFRLEEN